jgi:hypothetical protein
MLMPGDYGPQRAKTELPDGLAYQAKNDHCLVCVIVSVLNAAVVNM